MLKIGLTGGIGSGKSAASSLFEKQGVTVVDADIVAREVVALGRPALDEISSHFGREILTSEGELDRAQLRTIIFSNETEKQWLEELLHPVIRDEINQQLLQATSSYSILVSPLLLETNQHELVDRILVIDLPVQLQIDRASSRDDNNPEQIEKIIASQLPRECKIEKADDIICNELGFSELEQRVLEKHREYLELANE